MNYLLLHTQFNVIVKSESERFNVWQQQQSLCFFFAIWYQTQFHSGAMNEQSEVEKSLLDNSASSPPCQQMRLLEKCVRYGH